MAINTTSQNVDIAITEASAGGKAAYRKARNYMDRIALIDAGKPGATCARVVCTPYKRVIAAACLDHGQVRC